MNLLELLHYYYGAFIIITLYPIIILPIIVTLYPIINASHIMALEKSFRHYIFILPLYNNYASRVLNQNNNIKMYIKNRCPGPQAPDGFGLNPPSQLVIGYHWLTFLNQVRRNLSLIYCKCRVQNRIYLVNQISPKKIEN